MRKLSEILFYLPDRKSRFHDAENYFVGIKRISFYFISFFFTLKRKLGFKSKLPQVNFTSIDILKKIIKYKKKIHVLEFGSGYSTIWWLKKDIEKLTSIETDKKWFDIVSHQLKKNIVKPNFEYLISNDYISNHKYDLIIIDGGDRYINLKNSINNNLKKDTIIFFDNTDRIVHGEIRKIAIESLNKWANDKFVYTSRNFTPYNLNVTAGKFVFLSKTDFTSIIGSIK